MMPIVVSNETSEQKINAVTTTACQRLLEEELRI
jgi:hypothetical protein